MDVFTPTPALSLGGRGRWLHAASYICALPYVRTRRRASLSMNLPMVGRGVLTPPSVT